MKIVVVIYFSLFTVMSFAQKTITEQEIVVLALENSAAIRASGLAVRQNRELLKSAFNIPNVDVFTDSPTGLFYTIGVNQTIQNPSVYKRQYQLQKQQIVLSEKEKGITENDIIFRAKNLFLNLQFTESLVGQYRYQDSLYNQIRTGASRQFEAGQIDYLAKTFAESQANEIRNQYAQARADVQSNKRALQQFLGVAVPLEGINLQKRISDLPLVLMDSTAFEQNPTLLFLRQTEILNKEQIAVEKARSLPGFMVGFYNQGVKETGLELRFRFGLSVPIWFGQYKSKITAAQTGFQIAQQRSKAQTQALSVEVQQAQGDFLKYRQSLDYYENTGLKQSDEIINTASRLFKGGQNDYVSFLRTINDAYVIKQRYWETLRNYNQSLLNINYLTGNQ